MMVDQCYALVPAAGNGSRMQEKIPKQYLQLLDHPLIWYSLVSLLHPLIEHIYVILAPDDAHFFLMEGLVFSGRVTPLYCGGQSRSESVRNGLKYLSSTLHPSDFILVHDAARPCLSPENLEQLIKQGRQNPEGAMLGLPVADTIKRANSDGFVTNTVDRQGLWIAQTPQMFQYGLLSRAYEQATLRETDESQVMEAAGYPVKLVPGSVENLKVTWPNDLNIARFIIGARDVSHRPRV
ncbi:MAG: 2-C-methyl-D-erythritol 4-phosphate cytidylyltransferase [Pseudomonadota bacterium]|nr:2-C-methyl-D-erythritol 4-phosphate cytidylyltransferase [Pseudomonadota bacterium]